MPKLLTMPSIIKKVARQAYNTFSKRKRDNLSFQENLEELKVLVGQVNAKEVDLNMDFLHTGDSSHRMDYRPPVTYVEIAENSVYTMGIFILREGVKIPLHDHPRMYGIIKVIHGTICLQSYTASEDGDSMRKDSSLFRSYMQINTIKNDPVVVNDKSAPSCLTEHDQNFHEITAQNGPAAFLDILAPPYGTDGRDCHYYKEETTIPQTSSNNNVQLREIRPPKDFVCGRIEYTGPIVDTENA